MPRILISYCNADKSVAQRVCETLEASGDSCWIAPRDIPAGANWTSMIVDAIRQVDIVVVIVSTNTFESKHVAREIERADSHEKTIIPFFLEETPLSGALEYYLGSTQRVLAFPGPIEPHLKALIEATRTTSAKARALERQVPSLPSISDDDLVALGRAICWDIREELNHEVDPEAAHTVARPRHGQEVKLIDLACNRRARRTVARWQKKHGHDVLLTGEDFDPVRFGSKRPRVICSLDSLDGTQHWLRRRNLYCTALSLFARGENEADPYRLRVSMVQNADGAVFMAREDECATFVDELDTPLQVVAADTQVSEAQVCTVCRRPDHWSVLAPHIRGGVPFAALYTFGGNPILAELARGDYDAVFQPDASRIGDSQELWDWLPGGHIAYRAGCCILGLDRQPLDVPAAAELCLSGQATNFPFVAARSEKLAGEIVDWLVQISG
jgi:fructose-1,6-bisphosphatase/inositol monophosphatase family enzyme